MRKLWIVVGVLFVLLAVAGLVVVWSLNRLIAGNRDRIIEQAQGVLGRRVSVARISVGLWGGIGVQFDDVRIADDADLPREDFVRVATLNAHAKLWPLLHQRFELSRLVATQPHINVIRDATGRWNYTTLRPFAARDTAALAPGIIRVANEPAARGESRALPFVGAHAILSDGTLVVVDRTQTPVRTIQVAHLDAAVGYTGPASPVAVRAAGAVADDTRNFDVHGSVDPWHPQTGVLLRFDGTLGPAGPQKTRVDALHVVATLAPEHVQVTELTGRAFGGFFALTGDYPLHSQAPLSLKGAVKDLAVADAIQAALEDGAPRLGGTAHLNIDVRSTGTSREAIEASLAGSVVVDVQDGVIKNLNIANEVLERFRGMPIIGPLASTKIKPKYARLFADPDTHFETLHGTFMIGEQRARSDDLAIVAADYGVRGRGWLAFNGQTDVAGTLRMSQRFSDDVAADVKEAKYLFDDNRQLTVPFHLLGKIGQAKPTLDSDDIIAIVQRGAARGGAKNLLDKFLGGKRQATPGETKDWIDQGLRRLFGH